MEVFIPEDVATLFEALYAVEQPRDAWFAGVLRNLQPHLDRGLGVLGYFVDVSAPGTFRTDGFQAVGADPDDAKARFDGWDSAVPVSVKRAVHMFGPCALGGELTRLTRVRRADLARAARGHGYAEIFGVNALDASGHGCAIAVPHVVRTAASRIEQRQLWARVAAHIAAAARIHRRIAVEPSPAQGDAMLDARGRLEDGPREAQRSGAREALRNAAVAIDRTRSKGVRRDSAEVAELWPGLVDGRWSLVEQFDRGGRRYIVAYRNAPELRPSPALSLREEQVVRAAALGHSNGMIAYELGLSTSTVSKHLRGAASKLGVDGREALVKALAARER